MIGDARSHPWCSLNPLRVNNPRVVLLALGQWKPQALVRTGKIVESLKEGDASSHLVPILAEPKALSGKRSKSMSNGQIESLDQAGADREAELLESFRSAKDSLAQGLEPIPSMPM